MVRKRINKAKRVPVGKRKRRVQLKASQQGHYVHDSPYPELIFSYHQEKGKSAHGPVPLVDALEDYFVDMIAEGNPPNVVCDLAGLSRVSYSKWIKRGLAYEERLEEGEIEPGSSYAETEECYYRFMVSCRRAQAIYLRTRNVALGGENEQWRKDFAILERRDREHWGKEFADDRGKSADTYQPDDSFL